LARRKVAVAAGVSPGSMMLPGACATDIPPGAHHRADGAATAPGVFA
jgi:hypothetical protein